ncbi:MAG: DNA mismatch repair protein [Candidatus Scalindua rubra]|uniref:DNA mismatch repair protein MutL n=1 Tax=Candidatus Scalindua rubra TaxID=1872076 RepID=A0A1E3XA97_9BACT|nr:MAG: DNA mismatch repair protein [Candidatus Scalindua rubra]
MPKIKILPLTVVTKIAAGEVIERPVSVLKELIENSIDAGATHIEIQLEDGGKKLIRVSDNGIGMDKDDVELAFVSHATSKLLSDDDLFSVNTLGFRGEALPSIGAISQTRIISRTKSALIGSEIRIEGGKLHKIKEKGSPEGTQVDVRNLFYNTPVRRKFLKSTHTEMAHISEMVTRFTLAYPNIHFNTIHNGKNVLTLPPANDLKERITTIFGNEIGKNLITINSKEPNVSIYGYVLPPTHNRPNTKMQFIFLNGRYIRDNIISHAINAAYQNLLMSKRSPIVFVLLQVDTRDIDVNVHPTKIEVRFKNAGLIHDQIYSTIHSALIRTELHSPLKVTSQDKHASIETSPETATTRSAPVGNFKARHAWDKDILSHEKKESVMKSMSDFFSKSLNKKDPYHKDEHKQSYLQPSEDEYSFKQVSTFTSYIQIHNSYIVEETADGLNIIDQHALHEIVLYHEIWEQIKSSKLAVQKLLIPELTELTPRDYVTIISLKKELGTLGMEIEEFGKSTIAIRTHPQILKNLDFHELIQSVLEEVDSDEIKGETDNILRKIVKIMACKGAVKAGQKLASQEIVSLLEKRKDGIVTDFCPHGRPTTLEFKMSELEKQFKRK